jgi:hypothetical protein
MTAMRPLLCVVLLTCLPLTASEPATGWRGNGTGLWPDATPPTEWHRLPRGAMDGLRSQSARPKDDKPGDAPLVLKGLVRDWRVLGPFALKDSVRDFATEPVKDVASLQPPAGEWKATTVPADDHYVFGTAELPWLDLGKVVGLRPNQVAYAHTYLYSPRGGKARGVADHGHGLAVWLNGTSVYRSADRRYGLGYYTQLSRHELTHADPESARFELDLKPGWNRLLLKLSTANKGDFKDMRCSMRISDPPDVRYETKNVRWMTPLPGRSTSTPILVRDRLFVMAEPDQLLCVDKETGRIRWSAFVNYYEALPPEAKRKQPGYARTIDPLVAKLKGEADARKRLALRQEIQKQLLALDEETFRITSSGHFESHFGIVGFTMPTPVSDGVHVWVWSGMGVAACFDLDGNRRWITRVEATELNYGSSPAVADGVLAVFLNTLYGLETKTGKLLWEQPRVRYNVAAVLAGKLAGKQVFVMQRGDVVQPSDGSLLFFQRDSSLSADTGWAPGVILGDRVYSPKYGVTALRIFDFAEAKEAPWKRNIVGTLSMPPEVSRRNGRWIDRWTAGSPLVHDGLIYQTDIYQSLYVNDVKTGKLVVREEMDLEGLTHYNAVAVAASPTLVGKHVVVQDNQGTALVLKPGPKYEVVARNRLATQLERRVPIPAQETIGYAPPIADGGSLYIRGEAHLYRIAKD